jgi:hypothetical protein
MEWFSSEATRLISRGGGSQDARGGDTLMFYRISSEWKIILVATMNTEEERDR